MKLQQRCEYLSKYAIIVVEECMVRKFACLCKTGYKTHEQDDERIITNSICGNVLNDKDRERLAVLQLRFKENIRQHCIRSMIQGMNGRDTSGPIDLTKIRQWVGDKVHKG